MDGRRKDKHTDAIFALWCELDDCSARRFLQRCDQMQSPLAAPPSPEMGETCPITYYTSGLLFCPCSAQRLAAGP